MSPLIGRATEKLRNFMFQAVYIDSFAKAEEKRLCMSWKSCLSTLYGIRIPFQKNIGLIYVNMAKNKQFVTILLG